ncbi:MAG TPA: DUF1223 domain-containing protein [Myxococcales bacterium]|jgi:hypothetical protein|nr:DUF1223 domain-containing protein [Myxococcales bacterium]
MSRLLGVALLLGALPARAGDGRVPILLELFTSEGCSSCPPADAVLARLVREQPVKNVEIVGLSEHVDYWDSLGWRDPYSSAQFTERQQTYASVLGRGDVYTPQAVVDGHADVVGSDEGGIRRASSAAAEKAHGTIEVRADGRKVHLAATLPPHGDADVFLAAVDDPPPSHVQRGENAGRTLSHVHVVRALKRVARVDQPTWSTDIELEPAFQRLRLVAFVQERGTRRVLAAGSWVPAAGL